MGWAIPQGRYGEMKIDKFFQHRCYSKKRFSDVRCKVNKFLMQDSFGAGETVSRRPHKAKKLVQFQCPEQL